MLTTEVLMEPPFDQLEMPGISDLTTGAGSGAGSGTETRLLARGEWSAACEFHPLNPLEVLNQVRSRVVLAGKPVVLLDLDSTLYQVEPRSHQILKEWLDSTVSQRFVEERERLSHLDESHVGYSVRDTWISLGLDPTVGSGAQALDSVKKFWSDRFFRNEWLRWDRPYLGAAEYVRGLHQDGAQIVYLTGRDEDGMRLGTEANLVRDGFPSGHSSIRLWMKPSKNVSDLVFKKTAAERLRRLGVLVASFENEPHNLAGLQALYPEAMHVFMDTLCSDRPTSVCRGLYRIRSFEPVLQKTRKL